MKIKGSSITNKRHKPNVDYRELDFFIAKYVSASVNPHQDFLYLFFKMRENYPDSLNIMYNLLPSILSTYQNDKWILPKLIEFFSLKISEIKASDEKNYWKCFKLISAKIKLAKEQDKLRNLMLNEISNMDIKKLDYSPQILQLICQSIFNLIDSQPDQEKSFFYILEDKLDHLRDKNIRPYKNFLYILRAYFNQDIFINLIQEVQKIFEIKEEIEEENEDIQHLLMEINDKIINRCSGETIDKITKTKYAELMILKSTKLHKKIEIGIINELIYSESIPSLKFAYKLLNLLAKIYSPNLRYIIAPSEQSNFYHYFKFKYQKDNFQLIMNLLETYDGFILLCQLLQKIDKSHFFSNADQKTLTTCLYNLGFIKFLKEYEKIIDYDAETCRNAFKMIEYYSEIKGIRDEYEFD